MREVKRIENAAGDKRLVIYEGRSGAFFFHEEELQAVDVYLRQFGAPAFYWARTENSGLYGSAEDAERDARLMVKWLGHENDE